MEDSLLDSRWRSATGSVSVRVAADACVMHPSAGALDAGVTALWLRGLDAAEAAALRRYAIGMAALQELQRRGGTLGGVSKAKEDDVDHRKKGTGSVKLIRESESEEEDSDGSSSSSSEESQTTSLSSPSSAEASDGETVKGASENSGRLEQEKISSLAQISGAISEGRLLTKEQCLRLTATEQALLLQRVLALTSGDVEWLKYFGALPGYHAPLLDRHSRGDLHTPGRRKQMSSSGLEGRVSSVDGVGELQYEAELFARLILNLSQSIPAGNDDKHPARAPVGIERARCRDWLDDAVLRDTLDCYRTLATIESFLLRPSGMPSSVVFVDPRQLVVLVRLYYEPNPVILREVAGRTRHVGGILRSRNAMNPSDVADQLQVPASVVRRQLACMKEVYRLYKRQRKGLKLVAGKRSEVRQHRNESASSTSTSSSSSSSSDAVLTDDSDDDSSFSSTSMSGDGITEWKTPHAVPLMNLPAALAREFLLTPAVANRWACYAFFTLHRIQTRGPKQIIKGTRAGMRRTLHPALGDLEFISSVLITTCCNDNGNLKLDKSLTRPLRDLQQYLQKPGRKVEERFRPHILASFKRIWKERVEGNDQLADNAAKQQRIWRRQLRRIQKDSGKVVEVEFDSVSRFKSNCLPSLLMRVLRIGARMHYKKKLSAILVDCDERLLQPLISAFSSTSIPKLPIAHSGSAQDARVHAQVLTAQIDTVFDALLDAFCNDGQEFLTGSVNGLLGDGVDEEAQVRLRATCVRLLSALRPIVKLMLRRLIQHEKSEKVAGVDDGRKSSDRHASKPVPAGEDGLPDFVFARDVSIRWGSLIHDGVEATRVERRASDELALLP